MRRDRNETGALESLHLAAFLSSSSQSSATNIYEGSNRRYKVKKHTIALLATNARRAARVVAGIRTVEFALLFSTLGANEIFGFCFEF